MHKSPHMSQIDDVALLAQLRQEDTRYKAFETLFKHFYKPIRLQAYGNIGDFHEAEDIAQEVFKEFWTRQSFLEEDIRSFGAYLARQCWFRCGVHRDKKARMASKLNRLREQQAPTTVKPTVFLDALKYVMKLPRQQQKAIHLVVLGDLSYVEAAELMGITVGSLNKHLRLAKQHLAHIISS